MGRGAPVIPRLVTNTFIDACNYCLTHRRLDYRTKPTPPRSPCKDRISGPKLRKTKRRLKTPLGFDSAMLTVNKNGGHLAIDNLWLTSRDFRGTVRRLWIFPVATGCHKMRYQTIPGSFGCPTIGDFITPDVRPSGQYCHTAILLFLCGSVAILIPPSVAGPGNPSNTPPPSQHTSTPSAITDPRTNHAAPSAPIQFTVHRSIIAAENTPSPI